MLPGSLWMPLLVATLMYTSLFATGREVWGRRFGGSTGNLEPPAPVLVVFTSGHDAWVPWGCYEKPLWLGILWGKAFIYLFPVWWSSNLNIPFCIHMPWWFTFSISWNDATCLGYQEYGIVFSVISFVEYQKVTWTNNLFAIPPYNFLFWLAFFLHTWLREI